MAGSLIDRAFGLVEHLTLEPSGASLTTLADALGMPKSAAHRLLTELARLGYVRQDEGTERYLLTTKLLSLGFRHLSASGLIDVAQPILDRLANESAELARLAVVDGDGLTWVAKAQGAKSGLRYDPDMGQHVPLFCTATGQAWLASLDDETAIALASRQGFGRLGEHGPNAPRTVSSFLKRLAVARRQGFAFVVDSAGIGTSALAAVIPHPTRERALGTVNITGPSARLTEARMLECAPKVLKAARELSEASVASEHLSQAGRLFVSPPTRRRSTR